MNTCAYLCESLTSVNTEIGGSAVASKTQRHYLIAKVLSEHAVSKQSQLVSLLRDEGLEVTQATVSRDLEDMGALKVRVSSGPSVYALAELPAQQPAPADHLKRVLGEWLVAIARSGDLLLLRTPPGSANVIAAALDRSTVENMLGTVAGDDSVLVIAAEQTGEKLETYLKEIAGM